MSEENKKQRKPRRVDPIREVNYKTHNELLREKGEKSDEFTFRTMYGRYIDKYLNEYKTELRTYMKYIGE